MVTSVGYSKVLGAARCEHQPSLQGSPKGHGGAVAQPRVPSGWEGAKPGSPPCAGDTISPHCCSFHTEFCAPKDRQRIVQPAPASPFPLGCWEPPPGLPNLPSLFHQHPVFTWLHNPQQRGRKEEEEGGEPLPLPLLARGALLRRRFWAPLWLVPSVAPCSAVAQGVILGGGWERRGCLKPGFVGLCAWPGWWQGWIMGAGSCCSPRCAQGLCSGQ